MTDKGSKLQPNVDTGCKAVTAHDPSSTGPLLDEVEAAATAVGDNTGKKRWFSRGRAEPQVVSTKAPEEEQPKEVSFFSLFRYAIYTQLEG